MTVNTPRVNPLISSSSPTRPPGPVRSRRAAQSAVKFGGYGGMAVAAWFVTAVATGYGVSPADTTGTSIGLSRRIRRPSSTAGLRLQHVHQVEQDSTKKRSTASTRRDHLEEDASTRTIPSTTMARRRRTPSRRRRCTPSTQETSAETAAAPRRRRSTNRRRTARHRRTFSAPRPCPASRSAPSSPSRKAIRRCSRCLSSRQRYQSTTNRSRPNPTVSMPWLRGRRCRPRRPSTKPRSRHRGTDWWTSDPDGTRDETFKTNSVEHCVEHCSRGAPSSPIARSLAPATGSWDSSTPSSPTCSTRSSRPAPPRATPSYRCCGRYWHRCGAILQSGPNHRRTTRRRRQTGQTVAGDMCHRPRGRRPDLHRDRCHPSRSLHGVTDTGTLTIDQAANTFTYTPNDINYTDEVTHTFNVSATDGKTNLLSLFGVPHSDKDTVGVTVPTPLGRAHGRALAEWFYRRANATLRS